MSRCLQISFESEKNTINKDTATQNHTELEVFERADSHFDGRYASKYQPQWFLKLTLL